MFRQCNLYQAASMFALLLALVACGAPDQSTAQQGTSGTPTAGTTTLVPLTPDPTFDADYYLSHPELWPTHSPEEQTQAAKSYLNDTAVANRDATAFARPTWSVRPTPKIYPTPTPRIGLRSGCRGVTGESQFAFWNCWAGKYGNGLLIVRAGGESGDVGPKAEIGLYEENDTTIRGGILICFSNNDPEQSYCDPIYWRPEKEGRLKLIGVVYPHATLQAANGTLYGFNIETREWETPQAPPATPSATTQAGNTPTATP